MRSSTAAIALALAAGAAAAPQGVVYVTSVIDKTTTWCPVITIFSKDLIAIFLFIIGWCYYHPRKRHHRLDCCYHDDSARLLDC